MKRRRRLKFGKGELGGRKVFSGQVSQEKIVLLSLSSFVCQGEFSEPKCKSKGIEEMQRIVSDFLE